MYFRPEIKARVKKLAPFRVRKAVTAAQISFDQPESVTRLLDLINAAVPRHLPRDMRDDVISEMTLALIEGRLKRQDIGQRVQEFVRAKFKSDHNAWGPCSLDAPIWIDGSTTLLDTLASGSAGLWD